MLNKFLVFVLFITCSALSFQQTDTAGKAAYYSVLALGDSYFILSNKGILRLKYGPLNKFIYIDEISETFNSSTIFAVNNNQMFVKNRNSGKILIYRFDSTGVFQLQKDTIDTWNINLVEPFNNDFIVKSGNILKLISCNNDSIWFKDDSVTVYDNQQISYPYLVIRKNIYKYTDDSGYNLIYTLNDAIVSNWTAVFENTIAYRTLIEPVPGYPPTEADLRIRTLQEPEFPIKRKYSWWGVFPHDLDLLNGRVYRATNKYIELWNGADDLIYNYNEQPVILDRTDSVRLIPFNYFIFKLTPTSIKWTASDSSQLRPLIYEKPFVGIENDYASKPGSYSLIQNFPNPFNPITNIKYQIPLTTFVIMKVFDILGNEVITLVNEEKPAGTYEVTWNAAELPSGVYFYQLQAGNFVETKKMTLMK